MTKQKQKQINNKKKQKRKTEKHCLLNQPKFIKKK